MGLSTTTQLVYICTFVTNITMSRSVTRQFAKASSTSNLQSINCTTQNRPYQLNKHKALDKKLENCHRQHVSHEMKAGKNFVIIFSTAAYELAKTTLAEILNSEEFNEAFAIKTQKGIDLSESTVDLCYKIFYRKSNGQYGNQLKFTKNQYNSTNTMTANGNRVDIFVDDIFEELCKILKSSFKTLDVINENISSQLATAKDILECPGQNTCKSTLTDHVKNGGVKQLSSTLENTQAALTYV